MRVYRLEYAKTPEHGPFNPPMNDLDLARIDIYGFPSHLAPAQAAQAVAEAQRKLGPYDMPNMQHDVKGGIRAMQKFKHKVSPYSQERVVFGFSSLDQFREWFPTKLERKALFHRVAVYEQKDGPTGLELRCFNVPDDRVLVGHHQVMFSLDDATSSVRVSMKETIG